MKVAFFCEGESQAGSVLKFLNRLDISCVQLKRSDSDPPIGFHGIYIYNSRNDGKTLKDFETGGKLLLEKFRYDFVVAWCDRSPQDWCPKTIIQEIRKNSSDGNRMILLASIEYLENWLFADRETLTSILLQNKVRNQQYDAQQYDTLMKEIESKSENLENVEKNNVEKINAINYLKKLTWAVHGKATKYDKIEVAKAFFSRFSTDRVQGSKSFSRAIQRLKAIFKG